MSYVDMDAGSYCARPDKYMAVHNCKVEFITTLAELLGCRGQMGNEFPDGRRPDVLRIDLRRCILFVGDAKHTESPGCKATQSRLREYLHWLSVHVSRESRLGIFTICFSKESEIPKWIKTVSLLGAGVDLNCKDFGVKQFEPGVIVTWFVFHKCLAS